MARIAAVNWETGQLEVFTPKVNKDNKLELDLQYASFSRFPEEICEMRELKVLRLCIDNIHSIPKTVAKLRELEEIYLVTSQYVRNPYSLIPAGFGLQEVPTVVCDLPCLKVLSVCGNSAFPLLFDELMSCQLPSTLVEVQMVKCGLTQATLSVICNNVKLRRLDLSFNDLQSFECNNTGTIGGLTVLNDLEKLNLSWNENLHTFTLAGLTKLKELYLRYCNIQHLPSGMSDLHHLEKLFLDGNQLGVFPTFSCLQWKHLQTLDLSNCDLEKIQWELMSPNISYELNLYNNYRLLCLPNNIWNGLNLKILNLVGCGISSIPNTEVQIEQVHLPYTSVTYLPRKFVFSPKLQKLNVRRCPLVSPPIEVCERGISSIRKYLDELERDGGVRRGRIKILVMGITKAGKTSLVEALESGKPFLAELDERTIGVEETTMKLDDKIECKLLDCGGHKAYMLTNQLMFTAQCFRCNIGDFLQTLYERNSRAHVAVVVSKVDLMVDMSREEMSRKWNEHLHTRLRQFREIRQVQIKRMSATIAASDSHENKFVSERLQFLESQQITVEEKVILTSAATFEGVVSLKHRLRKLCGDERLLPSLHTDLPSSWVTVEDKLVIPQPHTSVPITDVSYAMQVCAKHGLTEERCLELLIYLNKVGSILYYSYQKTLSQVLFPVPPFVVNVLKAVFRHDHHLLEYDSRFIGADIGPKQFKEMKCDLVFNGIARVSMLLALWSEFHLTADGHVDVFIKLFLALDLAYLTGSSDVVVQELSDTLGRHEITSTVSMSTDTISTTSDSSIDTSSITSDLSSVYFSTTSEPSNQADQMDSCKELICKLKQHNVGLLLPWLLNDEEPDDVSQLWCADVADGVMQVVVEYSFAYNCPLGLFERLSARCHRHHPNYIRHWSSGLLMCYGAVSLLFSCSKNTSPGFLRLSARVVKSHHSVGRLWHVLLRCVSDVEDLLQSVPGVLFDRSICSEGPSTTSIRCLPNQHRHVILSEKWGSFAVETVTGCYSGETFELVEGIKEVCPSVKEGIPLSQVVSPASGDFVSRRKLEQIAADIGKWWPKLTSIIGTDQSTVSELRENYSDSSFAPAAASRILSEWQKLRNNRLQVCELYDALLVADIPSLPQRHLSDVMSPDAASGLAKSKETAARGETSRADSEMVTPLIIEKVAENGSERWHEIGIYLGVSRSVLTECDQPLYTLKEKLRKVLSAWRDKNREATVGQLLSACDEAGVGGIVRRTLDSDVQH
ncbi:malignant fibrous histiocytoma-amplified sequence 1 homolog isoform X2 [Corticium candelabrum]|uniref:malignant fibrous histiocytoma-amplified sequence 1 homolog isoform X2 n=1 Tax=Corticium candelabrum TaxID=121492 RepID=UPI002E255B2A|nr:malignant fibrous histiocytoma-amplified sequence 1 homolog isoform X2 [Corticium candelabrum]